MVPMIADSQVVSGASDLVLAALLASHLGGLLAGPWQPWKFESQQKKWLLNVTELLLVFLFLLLSRGIDVHTFICFIETVPVDWNSIHLIHMRSNCPFHPISKPWKVWIF